MSSWNSTSGGRLMLFIRRSPICATTFYSRSPVSCSCYSVSLHEGTAEWKPDHRIHCACVRNGDLCQHSRGFLRADSVCTPGGYCHLIVVSLTNEPTVIFLSRG